jgi:hypothetical protein
MTIDRPTTLPPSWAESLLRLILRPEDRDSVSGDLLEEYRQSIVPAMGAKANRWYIRQVTWYVLRATWAWGVLVAAICVWRYLLDTLAPIHYTPGVIALRSAVMSWAKPILPAVGACIRACRRSVRHRADCCLCRTPAHASWQKHLDDGQRRDHRVLPGRGRD